MFQVISLSSHRNMAIIGFAILLGLMVPTYVKNTGKIFETGKNDVIFICYKLSCYQELSENGNLRLIAHFNIITEV